jgi:tetratricopeptide (TPR) repeat protein
MSNVQLVIVVLTGFFLTSFPANAQETPGLMNIEMKPTPAAEDRNLEDSDEHAVPKHEYHADHGLRYLKGRDYRGAIESLTAAIEAAPKASIYRFLRATAYWRESDDDEALKDIAEAVKLDSDVADYLYLKGTIHLRKKDFPKAIKDLTRAYSNFGKKQLRTMTPKSLDSDSIANYATTLAEVIWTLGNAHLLKGDFLKLLEFRHKYLEVDRDGAHCADASKNIYLFCHDEKHFDICLTHMSKHGDLYCAKHEMYATRAAIYARRNNVTNAIAEYSKGVSEAPDNGDLYAARGHLYRKQGMFEPALQDYQNACKLAKGYHCIVFQEFKKTVARGTRWVKYGASNTSECFYDQDSVKREKGLATVWVRCENSGGQDDLVSRQKDEEVVYSKVLYEIKCKQSSIAVLQYIDYGENDKILYSSRGGTKKEFKTVVPDSVGESLLRAVCP